MIKKYAKGAVAVLAAFSVGVALVLGLLWFVNTFKFEDAPVAVMGPTPSNDPWDVVTTQGIAGTRVPYLSFLEIEDLEADGWYILVDLSDAANFPHARTNSINLKQIQHTGVLSNATHWDVHFGVVITTGTANSRIEWFHTMHRVRTTQFHQAWTLPEQGLNLSIKNEDELMFVASVEFTNTAYVTSSTALDSPVTASGVVTTTPGIGDLIMYVREDEAGGYFEHLSVGVSYDTQ